MKKLFRLGALGLLAAALTGLPLSVSAQTNVLAGSTVSTNTVSTNVVKAASSKKKKAPKKDTKKADTKKAPKTDAAKAPAAGPFHGNLAALDKNLKTITVGTRTFQITAETLIFKDGKPAALEDGVVGEAASGYVKPAADGKLNATKVTFGAKAETKSAPKKPAPTSPPKAEPAPAR